MIAALAFASLFASAASLSVQAGGPGNTIFIDYMQGAYVDDVAMPTEAVTVELWSKLVPQLGGTTTGGAWFSYVTVVNGSQKSTHLQLSPGLFCHDQCITYPFDVIPVDDGVWHHIALTWNIFTPAKLYIDGRFAYSLSVPGAPHPLIPGGVLVFGQNALTFDALNGKGFSASQPPHGQLDNFRLWSTVRPLPDIVSTMFTTLDAASAALASGLILDITFDHPTTVQTVSQRIHGSTANRTKFVSVGDELGSTVRGGCLNCSLIDELPTFTVSDCPVIGPSSIVPARLSQPHAQTLVPMPFVVNVDNCNASIFFNISLSVRIVRASAVGTLLRLDNVTVVTSGNEIDVFNGTNAVPTPGSGGCAVYGSALASYIGSGVSSDYPLNFTYTVTVTSVSDGSVSTSNPGTVVISVDQPLVLLNKTLPAMGIGGPKNVFDLGVINPDGHLPVGVVISDLPMFARLWQSDGSVVHQPNTSVIDPLGRLVYDPNTNVRGSNVDGMSFMYANAPRPMQMMFRLLTSRDGTVAPSVWSLIDAYWLPLALDCGGHNNPVEPLCQAQSKLSQVLPVDISVAPSNLMPFPTGLGVRLTPGSVHHFLLQSTNTSFASFNSVLHTGNDDPRLFGFLSWIQPDAQYFVLGSPVTLHSLYGWCDSSRSTICEKIRTSAELVTEGTGVLFRLSLQCGAGSVFANATALVSTDSFGMGSWTQFSLVWAADLHYVCLNHQSASLCLDNTAFVCPTISDDSNSAESVAGAHRLLFGSRLSGTSIYPAVSTDDMGSDPVTNFDSAGWMYVSTGVGVADDLRLYQFQSQAQWGEILAVSSVAFDPSQPSTLPLGGELLALLNYDNPLDMLWQPPAVTSVFPDWFQFQTDISMPEITLASALAARTLTSLANGFSFNHSLAMLPFPLPAGELPLFVRSSAPSFNLFPCKENTNCTFQLVGYEPDNGYLVARVFKFPANGTLYNVNDDGSIGDPVAEVSSPASDNIVRQWVKKVLAFQSEWASSSQFLQSLNTTLDDVYGGDVPQSVFSPCYCSLGLIGPADCPQTNADCPNTWNPLLLNQGTQYIDLQFEQKVLISQVEVYIPYGGQETVSIQAWNYLSESWIEIYSATACGVTVTLNPSTPISYVILRANPCRTTFATDTIRVIFDTDLTQQWLMVDAVRLSGTLSAPIGTVTNAKRYVAYVPDPFVYGVDSFSYKLTDCPFQDSRFTSSIVASVDIAGKNNPAYIASTSFPVSNHLVSTIDIPMADMDSVNGINGAMWQESLGIIIYTLPTLCNISYNDGSGWVTMVPSGLPYIFPGSVVSFRITPTTSVALMPLLCNGEDSFLASGRNLNLTAPHGDGPVTNITLEFDCAIIVCGAGQRIARLSSGSPVCITCPSGTYNADVNSTCKPCPPGGACTGGSSLAAQAGYFYFEQSFYKCKDQRCCVTGGCPVSAGNVCSGGRAGLLCSGCASSHDIPSGNVCQRCDQIGWVPLIMLVGATIVIVLLFLHNDYNDIQSRFKQYIDYNQLFELVINSRGSHPSYYIQKVGLLGLVTFNFSTLSSQYTLPCLAPLRGLQKYIVESYAMAILLSSGLFCCLVYTFIKRKLRGEDFDSHQFYQTLWQIILLCYTTTNVSSLSLIKCTSVGPYSVLAADDSILCTGSGYYVVLVIALFFSGLASIVLPLYIIWSHARHNMVQWHEAECVEPPEEESQTKDKVAPDVMKLEDAPAVGSDAARPQSRASDAGTLASASRGINDILEHSTYGEGLMSGSGATDADISLPAEPEATIVQPPPGPVVPAIAKTGVHFLEPIPSADGEEDDQASVSKENAQTPMALSLHDLPRPKTSLIKADRGSALVRVPSLNKAGFVLPGERSSKQGRRSSIVKIQTSLITDDELEQLNTGVADVSYVDGIALIGIKSKRISQLPRATKGARSQAKGLGAVLEGYFMKLAASLQHGARLRDDSSTVTHFSVGEALVQRTRMYRDEVRWWYEAYFLSRRTLFVLLSVLFQNNDLKRSQLTFLAMLAALLFQCRLMPYRLPGANFREIVMLCFLCIAAGYELLRVPPVFTSIPNTGIADVVVSLVTALAGMWIMRHVSLSLYRKGLGIFSSAKSKMGRGLLN